MKRNKLNRQFRRNLIVSLMTLSMIQGMNPVTYGGEKRSKEAEDLTTRRPLRGDLFSDRKPVYYDDNNKRDSRQIDAERERLEEEFKEHVKSEKLKKLLEDRKKINEQFLYTYNNATGDSNGKMVKDCLDIEKKIQDLLGITREKLLAKYENLMIDQFYAAAGEKPGAVEGAGGPKINAGGGPQIGPFLVFPQPKTLHCDEDDFNNEICNLTTVTSKSLEDAASKVNDAYDKVQKKVYEPEELQYLETFGPSGSYGKRLIELRIKKAEEKNEVVQVKAGLAMEKYMKLKQKQYSEKAKATGNGYDSIMADVEKIMLSLSRTDKANFQTVLNNIMSPFKNGLINLLHTQQKSLENGGGFKNKKYDYCVREDMINGNKVNDFALTGDRYPKLSRGEKEEVKRKLRQYYKDRNYVTVSLELISTTPINREDLIDSQTNTPYPRPCITKGKITYTIPVLKFDHNGDARITEKILTSNILLGQYLTSISEESNQQKIPMYEFVADLDSFAKIEDMTNTLYRYQKSLLKKKELQEQGQPVESLEKIMKEEEKLLTNDGKGTNGKIGKMLAKHKIKDLFGKVEITNPFKKTTTTNTSKKISSKTLEVLQADRKFKNLIGIAQQSKAKEAAMLGVYQSCIQEAWNGLQKEFGMNEPNLEPGLDSKKAGDITIRELFNVDINEKFEMSKVHVRILGKDSGTFYYGDVEAQDKKLYDAMIAGITKDELDKAGVFIHNKVPYKEGLEKLRNDAGQNANDIALNPNQAVLLGDNHVTYEVLTERIGFYETKIKKIKATAGFDVNQVMQDEAKLLEQKQNYVRSLRSRDKTELLNYPTGIRISMQLEVRNKAAEKLKKLETDDTRKNERDTICQNIRNRYDSLLDDGHDNTDNMLYDESIDYVLKVTQTELNKKLNAAITKMAQGKNRIKLKQPLVGRVKQDYEEGDAIVKHWQPVAKELGDAIRDQNFAPRFRTNAFGNPLRAVYMDLYEFILKTISGVNAKDKKLEEKPRHMEEFLLKAEEKAGLKVDAFAKKSLNVDDKSINDYKKLAEDKKLQDEDEKKQQEIKNIQDLVEKETYELKRKRAAFIDKVVLDYKTNNKIDDLAAKYQTYLTGPDDVGAKLSYQQWVLKTAGIPDQKSLDEKLTQAGINTKIKSLDERLKELDQKMKDEEDRRKKKEEDEKKKKADDLKQQIEKQQKAKEDEEKRKQQEAETIKKNMEELDNLLKSKDVEKIKEALYHTKEEEEQRAKEEAAKKKAEEEAAKKKAEEEAAKKKAEEEAKKEEAKKEEAKEEEAKEEEAKEEISTSDSELMDTQRELAQVSQQLDEAKNTISEQNEQITKLEDTNKKLQEDNKNLKKEAENLKTVAKVAGGSTVTAAGAGALALGTEAGRKIVEKVAPKLTRDIAARLAANAVKRTTQEVAKSALENALETGLETGLENGAQALVR